MLRPESLIARLPLPSPGVRRAVGIAAVVAQGGIGVTGSVVRVTGSGLGCPTWPQCVSGSMFPVAHPELSAVNQWIEFGNRLLAVVIVLVAALCVLVAWRLNLTQPRRRLMLLAWAMPLGVVVQAVLGGITVLAKLQWWTVAIHFLATTPLVWLAVLLLHAFGEGDRAPRWHVDRLGRTLLVALAAVLWAVLVAGTTVTGAGPHGGDAATHRLDAPIETLARVHSGLLIGFLVVLAVFGLVLRRGAGVPARLWRRYGLVWLVALAQGGLGFLQYFLGVPEALVSFHVLGAALVITATAALWVAARDRGPLPAVTDGPVDAELAAAN